jgi:type I restriction enzyme S subunit
MTLETFFEKFNQFVDAPGAVGKMREIVLRLAVQGKLSSQMPSDAPVAELCEALSRARHERIKSGEHRLQTATGGNDSADRPITTPEHWAWVPLNQIGELSGGMTPSKAKSTYWNGEVNWFSSKDIKPDELTDSGLKITSEGVEATGLQLYPQGCLFMVARSGILKRTFPVSINCVEATANQDLKVLTPFVSGLERYLQIMFRGMTNFILSSLVKTGMTVQSLKYEEFEVQPFPLPPLAEQKRIVAKVDELMALCDRLEAQQQERETRHTALACAALARFADAPTPANLDFLFHDSYTITPADLRKSILTLAVQGKLVPQDPNDEPAEKTFAGLKPLIGESSDGADIPNQWALCSYRSLTTLVTSGSRGWKEFYAEKGSIFVRTQNIKTDKLVLDDVAFVDLPKSAEGMRAQVLKDDILVTITGANVTKAARVEEQIPEAYVSQHIALTRPRWSKMSEWLHLCFISHGSARGILEQLTYGDKPGLNLNNIRDLVLPIPPLAEQHRIVAKVEQLMTLVDELETQLTQSHATSEKLMEAVVAELTNQG